VSGLGRLCVRRAVELEDELQFPTIEIRDETMEHMLSAKFEPKHATSSQE